jgi:hypothetical protein
MIKVISQNSNPIVIHGNGTSKNEEVYSILRQRQFERPIISDANNFTFISWKGGNISNKKTILEQSGDQYGFNVLNLNWKHVDGFWKATQQKVTSTLDAINAGLIKTEYVFWLDNTDVFFIDSPSAFLKKFQQAYPGIDFVWNAEKNNFPTPSHVKWKGSSISAEVTEMLNEVIEHDFTYESVYRHMNSGAGFGKLSSLKEQLEIANSLIGNSRLTDQGLMRIAQHKLKDTVAVDRTCELFLCCWGVHKSEIEI